MHRYYKVLKRGMQLATGTVILVYFGISEPVPLSNRHHSVIFPKSFESEIGDQIFQSYKESDGVLPPHHPDCQLVNRVGKCVFLVLIPFLCSFYHKAI